MSVAARRSTRSEKKNARSRPASSPSRKKDAHVVLLQAQTHALQLLAENRDLEEVLDSLLRPIEKLCGNRMLTSVLVLDGLGKHLQHCAGPSLPKEFRQVIDGSAIGPLAGSCGTAAFTKKPVYVKDVMRDKRWLDYRELAERHGLRACWSTPAFADDGSVLATFAMYYRRPTKPSAFDKEIIAAVSRTAVVAITKARRIEALIETQQRLHALFHSSPVGVLVTEVDGKVTSTNPSSREICGFTNAEALGEGWKKFVHPADLERVTGAWQKAIATHKAFEMEVRWLLRLRRTVLRSCPIKLKDGKVVGHMVTIADRTERLSAEEKALSVAADILAIFDSSPLALILFDEDGVVRAWNWKAEEIMGWKAKEVIGCQLPTSPSGEDAWMHVRDQLIRGRVVNGMKMRQVKKDGRGIDVQLWAAPVVSENGTLQGFVAHMSNESAGTSSAQQVTTSGTGF